MAAPLDPRVRRLRAGEECEDSRAEARFQLVQLQARPSPCPSSSPGASAFGAQYYRPRTAPPAQSLRPRRFQEVVVPDGDDAMDEDAPVSCSVSGNGVPVGDDAEMSECPSPGESEDPLTPASSSSGSPQSMSMELDAPANSYFGANANANALPRALPLFPTSSVCSKRKMDVCDADDALFAAQPPAKRVTVVRANMHPFALPTPTTRNHAGLYVATTTAAVSFARH